MPESNMLPVQFISSYNGRADYGVYVRRLNRDVRVGISQDDSRAVFPITAELTEEEKQNCIASLMNFLANEHEKFMEWKAKYDETYGI